MKPKKTATALLSMAFLISAASCGQLFLGPPPEDPGATPFPAPWQPISPVAAPVDGYLAVAPRVLRAGQREMVSVSLFSGQRPATGAVQLALLQDGRPVAQASATVRGKGEVPLEVPRLSEGDYELKLTGQGFEGGSPVRVEDSPVLFVETDKPVYKPGQTMHIRVLALDPELKPVEVPATVEVADAKGTKVFKKDTRTDGYGMASLDLPLSPEPNLGVWKVSARAGKATSQVDVRVERYVLPKYEIVVSLPREWVLASEPISGSVRAEYSYGKAVKGEVQVRATRYVGTWQEFANVTRPLEGSADFRLPAVGYVSGVPGAQGMGNVSLEVTVREASTGYEEKTTRLLSVAASPVTLRIIPESVTFKPSLPLSLLVVAETPDKKPVDAGVRLDVVYTKKGFATSRESLTVQVKQGKGMAKLTPPADAISLSIGASSGAAHSSLALQSGYSPSGSFILVEPVGDGKLRIGDRARFKVSSTKEAANFYYEVLARGKVLFSSFSRTPDIEFGVTPLMAPSARLLVYQILPNSEVAADYVPFSVEGRYPQRVEVGFSQEEVRPGQPVDVRVQTEGPAKVGLAAVDRSVFILAENRLNLQQVFAELERLNQKPQVELHEARPLEKIATRGAAEVFADAGVVVLSNQRVPRGEEYPFPRREMLRAAPAGALDAARTPAAALPAPAPLQKESAGGLAEVQRVRQFFPETWIWDYLETDPSGRATRRFEAPDSITTWMLRAVALSKQTGLGISEAQLRVMQPFFVQVDLPYSAIRGEQFPVKVALYNYTATSEDFTVELERAGWFDLLDQPAKSVQVGANSVAAASFTIRPRELGKLQVKITARSRTAADAIVKEIIIEPEGVQQESVENLVMSAGTSRQVDTSVPDNVVQGSARVYLALTGNYLTQTIEGLEGLLKMPFGCGEQNMILFAPNVFVTRYLKETGQVKPEVMAKAENLMITGYQREVTYRRSDGSFSAFGNNDKVGSLWLTAFVLKTFAQAKDIIYIDDSVLSSARAWIAGQQKADGSFEPVGFVHHQEMLGGLQGKTALTAYLAVALREAGDEAAFRKAAGYLEKELEAIQDTYALALAAYALELGKSPRAGDAYNRLMARAQESDEGLHWDAGQAGPVPLQPGADGPGPRRPSLPVQPNRSAAIETTSYAMLALLKHGDRLNASRAARWLVSRRNSYGGFGSTQDTVVGLQALTEYAAGSKSDVDATVTLRAAAWQKEVRISPENADVLQQIDLPLGRPLTLETRGKGQVVLQVVRRYNVPDSLEKDRSAFQVEVSYGTGEIEVNDLIDVKAKVRFTPPMAVAAGMVVLDVAVPTGFAAEADTISALLQKQPKLKRYDISGRKVILYIEDMMPDEELQIAFKARALYPVRAQPVASQAYSYYRPEWRGESLGGGLVVR